MRAVIFFISLCILLLAGDSYVYAAAYNDYNYTAPTPAHESTCRIEMAPVKQDCFTVTDADPDKAMEGFISDDVDDEDPNSFPTPKYRAATVKSAVTYSPPRFRSILKYLPKSFNPAVHCSVQVCDRYLLQGVLRI